MCTVVGNTHAYDDVDRVSCNKNQSLSMCANIPTDYTHMYKFNPYTNWNVVYVELAEVCNLFINATTTDR